MNGAFYVGATGLQAQQTGLETIANNVANVNTNTFKRSDVRFSELVMQGPVRADNDQVTNTAPVSLTGVQSRETVRVFQQGDLRQTGKPFDLAIDGDGFVEVLGPGGQTWLWRGGGFRINADGFIETETGLTLKALIEVPDEVTELRIDREGRVTGLVAGSEDPTELGVLTIAMPEDPSAIVAVGDGYYRAAEGGDIRVLDPGEDGMGVFVQGSVEASNVELTTEMVGLLLAQRAYAANAQVVQAGDQLMAIANGLRR